MKKKTLRDINLQGKRVLMRVDFNVPLEDGKITDDTRIRAALPSIEYVLKQQPAALLLASHLGRPKGRGCQPEFSLRPVADHLAGIIGRQVAFAEDCLEAGQALAELPAGEILMLENTRFHAEEEGKVKRDEQTGDEEYKKAKEAMRDKQLAMARKLASYCDVYVNDAFGTAHRAHASTAMICQFVETCVAGLLMEKEIEFLGRAVENPSHPFVAVIGGAKVSGKLEVLRNLMGKVDTFLIGGGMAFTFLKAQGIEIGNSLVENELLETAAETMREADQAGAKFMLPLDHIIADKFAAAAERKTTDGQAVESGWLGLDIGPQTMAAYAAEIKQAKTVVWNGPMGCFEMAPFAEGTMKICQAVADSDSVSIIGGGDSVSAVNQSGLAERMSHISTGGGASLEFLEGKPLPGVVALDDK